MRYRPAFHIVTTFFLLILGGSLALYYFGFKANFQESRLMSAIFTSTSSVCVTGLTIADLSRDFTFTGQLIVLLLIQMGGLGLFTLSNWFLLSLRGKLGLYSAIMTREVVGGLPRLSAPTFLKKLMLFTFIVEAVGATLLFAQFTSRYSTGYAIWLACFHSISAFCNAGFSLFSNSLMQSKSDPILNFTIMTLIISGGVGFVVVIDILEYLKSRFDNQRFHLSFHTRVVISTTGVLTIAGFLVFLIFEWNNTFNNEWIGTRLLESLFLSVTARTAGFNTVPTGHLTNMTLVFLIFLMLVGASPGSTGGGIKTTSIAIIWSLVKSKILNRRDVEMFGYTIPYKVIAKALSVMILYSSMAFLAMMVLQGTEFGELPHTASRGMFLEQLFEVISALSTVGLSTGITTHLSKAGLGVIIICMFVGRIGPLVLATSLIGERKQLQFRYPEGEIMVG